jgi:hypothetical protein
MIGELITIGTLTNNVNAGFKERRASPARNSSMGQFLTGSVPELGDFPNFFSKTLELAVPDLFIENPSAIWRIAAIGRDITRITTSATKRIDFEGLFIIAAISLIFVLTASHCASFLNPKNVHHMLHHVLLFNADVAG